MEGGRVDPNHVDRPHYTLPHGTPGWNKIETVLSAATENIPTTVAQLTSLMIDLAHACSPPLQGGLTAFTPDDPPDLPSLRAAIDDGPAHDPNFDFWSSTLPTLIHDVLALPTLFPDPSLGVLEQNVSSTIAIERKGARAILSAAFFGICTPYQLQHSEFMLRRSRIRQAFSPDTDDDADEEAWAGGLFGDISFLRILGQGTRGVGKERVLSLLLYFHATTGIELEGEVCFHRACLGEGPGLVSPPQWEEGEGETQFGSVTVVHDIKIEDVDVANLHIDFANKHLHIGSIIPSATQEEVLFSVRPECFIGLLFSETMLPHEAILISGAPKYITYAGYLYTFRVAGLTPSAFSPAPDPCTVVAIDAMVAHSPSSQFLVPALLRDLNKAYVGFSGLPPHPEDDGSNALNLISTGMWGCGVFNGDPTLKFCQQIMAAAVLGADVHYSTFGKPDVAESHTELYQALLEHEVSVSTLFSFLAQWDGARTDPFHDYLLRRIRSQDDSGFAQYRSSRGFSGGSGGLLRTILGPLGV